MLFPDYPFTEFFEFRVIFPALAIFVFMLGMGILKWMIEIYKDVTWKDSDPPKILCQMFCLIGATLFFWLCAWLGEVSYSYKPRITLPHINVKVVNKLN